MNAPNLSTGHYGHRLLSSSCEAIEPLPATGTGANTRLRIVTTFGAFEFVAAGVNRPTLDQLKSITQLIDAVARSAPTVP